MIDAPEALLAITGLGFITGARRADVSEDEIERARKLDAAITTRAKRALTGTPSYKPPTPLDFKRVLKHLSRIVSHQDNVERQQRFPVGYHRLATAYNLMLGQVQAEVLKMLPRQAWDTVAGVQVGVPSDLKIWAFVSIVEVLDDPLQVFDLISTGAITKKQALAVQLVYPTFSQAVSDAFQEVIVGKRGADPAWLPDYRTAHGLAAWQGGSATPASMLARSQEAHAVARQKQEAIKQAPVAADVNTDGAPSDRATFGAPR
ncbi:MAG TPA: hypothetical protein VLZ78_02630 [Terrimesophilobacter sp.]|nr:hypothetical protein [Terrimesophilobacter sp.]